MRRSVFDGALGVAVLAASLAMPWERPVQARRRSVEPRNQGSCSLPGCDKPANRGGYCCADHCDEARTLDRKKRGYTCG